MADLASFSSVWGDLRESLQEIGKIFPEQKMRASRAEKLGLKIVQTSVGCLVKGVMPPEGGITLKTPIG